MIKENNNILAVCSNPDILKTMVRLINAKENLCAAGARCRKEAMAALQQKTFDLVLIGSGIEDEELLKEEVSSLGNNTVCVEHYGGGSGLLQTEIVTALEKRNVLLNNK